MIPKALFPDGHDNEDPNFQARLPPMGNPCKQRAGRANSAFRSHTPRWYVNERGDILPHPRSLTQIQGAALNSGTWEGMNRFVGNKRVQAALWVIIVIAGVLPLWVTLLIPSVDMAEHLYLISVLHRLHDNTTLFPEYFALRPHLVTYVGYYYSVAALSQILPLDLANRLFLSVYVMSVPLSAAFLLRSLRRPSWPAALMIPFAYGDNFAWGFVSFIAAIPLAFVAAGAFVRTITDAERRWRWSLCLALALVGVLLFHIQMYIYLAFALPFVLLTTRSRAGAQSWLKPRVAALVGVVPSVVQFGAWLLFRFNQSAPGWLGAPPKGLGEAISLRNMWFLPLQENLSQIASFASGELRFPALAGMLRNGGDEIAMRLVLLVAFLSIAIGWWERRGERIRAHSLEDYRMLGLALLTLVLYFALPFTINGFIEHLNRRFLQLGVALLVCAVPVLTERWHRWGIAAGATVSVALAIPLTLAFHAFHLESEPLLILAAHAPPKAKMRSLIFEKEPRAFTHPVFNNAGAVVSRAQGGIGNSSFAATPQSPVMYKVPLPPDTRDWRETMWYYDTYLLRGPSAQKVFGASLYSEFKAVDFGEGLSLVVRR